MAKTRKPIPVKRFGRDHWSLLAYVECRCVDNKAEHTDYGVLDFDHMRSDPQRHPLLIGPRSATVFAGLPLKERRPGPTRLKDGQILNDYDDWDCLEDLEAAGYVEVRSLVNGFVRLTDEGRRFAAQIRAHKSRGGSFSTFPPPRPVAAAGP